MILGTDVVPTIENPLPISNAALHVFADHLFATPHLQWDGDTLQEGPFDGGLHPAAWRKCRSGTLAKLDVVLPVTGDMQHALHPNARGPHLFPEPPGTA